MGAYKPVPVIILSPVKFIGVPMRQGRTGRIQGSWYPKRSVAMITMVGIPVEEALDYIGIKIINVVIHMECGGEASLVTFIG